MDLANEISRAALYSELRIHSNSSKRIGVRDGNLIVNTQTHSSGISCRSFDQGQWGMSSSSKLHDIAMVIDTAQTNAQFMSGMNSDAHYRPLNTDPFSYQKSYVSSFEQYNQKQVIDFCQLISAKISKTYPDLKSHEIFAVSLELEKQMCTSAGSVGHHHLPRTMLVLNFYYESNGEVVSLRDFISTPDRANASIYSVEKTMPIVQRLYERVREKSKGVFPQAGLKDVVIGPAVTGVLVHEAIGHPSEADLVDAGAITRNLLNKTVCSDLITMVDLAHSYNGKELPVPVYIDDEGTKAEDVTIIDKGVYKGYMNNKETAAKWNMPASGNARAFAFDDEPLIRMRNTVLLPGASKFEELIGSIDDGYFFADRSNGQADLTSEFMFGVTFGYEIKRGKLGRAIKDTTISGVAFDMLKTIDMVSDDFLVHSVGMCGKKQPMMVSHGGPSIKCRVQVGGK